MLKDYDICSGSSLHNGYIYVYFQEPMAILLIATASSFGLPTFCLINLTQYLVDRETLSTCCHIEFSSIQNSLVLTPLKSSVEVKLDYL